MWENLIQEGGFDSFLQANQDKLVLVKFFVTWCSPCRVLKRNIQELLTEKKDLVVLAVDGEKFPQLAQRSEFKVRAFPTIFLFRAGKAVKEERGSLSIQQLRKFISD